MTVAELGERMSSAELTEWMAYYSIEPFGEERADLRQAMTTSAITNMHQAQTKKPHWTKPEDFMLFSKREKAQPKSVKPASPEHLMAKFNAVTKGKKGTG